MIIYLFRASAELLHAKLSGYASGNEIRPEARLPQPEQQPNAFAAGASQAAAPAVKQRIVDQKTGRNDPCPCGSGAKYKYCCGK